VTRLVLLFIIVKSANHTNPIDLFNSCYVVICQSL